MSIYERYFLRLQLSQCQRRMCPLIWQHALAIPHNGKAPAKSIGV
jgi:hypothetical protein